SVGGSTQALGVLELDLSSLLGRLNDLDAMEFTLRLDLLNQLPVSAVSNIQTVSNKLVFFVQVGSLVFSANTHLDVWATDGGSFAAKKLLTLTQAVLNNQTAVIGSTLYFVATRNSGQ